MAALALRLMQKRASKSHLPGAPPLSTRHVAHLPSFLGPSMATIPFGASGQALGEAPNLLHAL